jgi:hypothetical protein
VIRRFDGHIAQYLGDGLLVYFGYPQAHEDDARRAVYTGLEILAAMQRLNTRLERERRVQLAVRLGIHTGLVVVGEMGGSGRQEQLSLGGRAPVKLGALCPRSGRTLHSRPYPTGSEPGSALLGARPMRKRLVISARRWRSSRFSLIRPSMPNKNSRCNAPWERRC